MRSAQAAIEYLFMIALALTMVLIVIRLMKESTQQASRNIDRATRKILETLQNMTGG